MKNLKDKILLLVEGDLADIETALAQNLKPNLKIVTEAAGHILFSGGKRLRPLLMILSARMCGYTGNYDKTFSTIFEYLHTATLLHDDLVDGAAMRRGKPVAHSVWGNSTAVLVGDFLLARALSIAAETGLPEIIRVIADITENMSQGEIHQILRKGQLDLSKAEYMEVIRRKTAVLFQGACRISAILAGAADDKESALSEYGFNLGLAFQMADDLLDYTSDAAVLGKEIGADLKEGKLTLPVIHSLEKANAADRRRMETIITDSHFSDQDFKKLVGLLHGYGGITYTKKLASRHIEKAKRALSVFEPSKTREILLDVADYTIEREA